MTLITRLANAIRKEEPQNLFCILELGDERIAFINDDNRDLLIPTLCMDVN